LPIRNFVTCVGVQPNRPQLIFEVVAQSPSCTSTRVAIRLHRRPKGLPRVPATEVRCQTNQHVIALPCWQRRGPPTPDPDE
jgi:hypothetical protein